MTQQWFITCFLTFLAFTLSLLAETDAFKLIWSLFRLTPLEDFSWLSTNFFLDDDPVDLLVTTDLDLATESCWDTLLAPGVETPLNVTLFTDFFTLLLPSLGLAPEAGLEGWGPRLMASLPWPRLPLLLGFMVSGAVMCGSGQRCANVLTSPCSTHNWWLVSGWAVRCVGVRGSAGATLTLELDCHGAERCLAGLQSPELYLPVCPHGGSQGLDRP